MKRILFGLIIGMFLLPFVLGYPSDYIAYWNFDNSARVGNSTTGILNWTQVGTITSGTGCILGNCSRVNGNATANYLTRSQFLDTGVYSSGTFSVWIKFNQTGGHIGGSGVSGGNTKWFITLNSTGTIYSNINNNVKENNTYLLNQSEYNFISMVWDSSKTYIYANGVKLNEHPTRPSGSYNEFIFRAHFTATQYKDVTYDEASFFSRNLSSSELVELYNYYFSDVELNNPENNSATAASPLVLNSTARSPNGLINITYYLWNSTGLVNKTNFSISGTTNVSSVSFYNVQTGRLEWNVLACDSVSCFSSENNNTLFYGFNINSINYSSTTYETSNENFILNITSLVPVTSAKLMYGSDIYNGLISLSGTETIISSNIDIPLNVVGSKSFYYVLNFTNGESYTSQTYTQNILSLNLSKCGGAFTTKAINFTLKDEITQQIITGGAINSSIGAFFEYWTGNGEVKKNYTYSEINSNNNSFAFCIMPSSVSLKTNLDLDYQADNYQPRQYYLRNAILTNITSEVNLYLLESDEAVKFFLTITQGTDFIQNAVIQISKFFVGDGTYKQIGVRESDELGQFVEYLEPDSQYRYTIIKDGVVLGVIDKVAICSSTPCLQVLELSESFADLNERYDELYAQDVVYSLTFDPETKMVSFIFTDTTGLANYFRLNVTQIKTSGSTSVCDLQLNTPSGTLSCNLTNYTGEFKATTYISRSPEKIVDFIDFIIQNATEIFGVFGIFISLLVIITLVFVGVWNPVVVMALIPVALVVLKLMQFLPLGWGVIVVVTLVSIYLIGRVKT